MRMKILVTGGAGFIGSHITKELIQNNHEVTITSTGSERVPNGVKKVLYTGLEGISLKYDYGQDLVIHQMANNDTRCQDEEEMFRANVYGPIKIFTAAAQGGCKNFIYASSTAVYGSETTPYVEDITPIKPLSKYGESKAKFDEFAIQFGKDYKVVGLRYCNVYGPGEEHKGKRASMVTQILNQMIKFKPAKIFKDGEQKRDWIYVKDVVKANMLVMENLDKINSTIYNIGNGISISFNKLIEIINGAMGNKEPIQPEYIECPFESEYQSHTECSIEKVRKELQFFPDFDIEHGVKEIMRSIIFAS